MSLYAINQKGADSFRELSKQLNNSLAQISDADKKMQTSVITIMDKLGIYGLDIWSIILKVNDIYSSCSDEIEQLSEKINAKADEIEELLSLTGSTPSSQSPGAASGKNVQTLEQISSWLTEINPHYYDSDIPPWQDNPYHSNCGSCTLAVEKHFLGDTNAVASDINIRTDAAMEAATGKTCTYMSIGDIENILKERGSGSHLIVGINRKPALFIIPQKGHWFNAYYDGKEIYTIDGQTGEIMEWPHDYGSVSEWCALI